MNKKHTWQELVLVAVGIFIGTFWLFFGFLSVVGTTASLHYYIASLAPGSAVVFFVLMARRSPIPYGGGLILLGIGLLCLSFFRRGSLTTGLVVGVPVAVLGLLFVLLRHKIKVITG